MNEEQIQTPAVETPEVESTVVPPTPPKKSKLWLKILIPILIVIVLGGIGVSAYYYFFATDYEAALMETFDNMKEVKSFHYDYSIDLVGSQEGNEMTTKVQVMGDALEKGEDLVDFSTNMILSSDIGMPSSDTQSIAINAAMYFVDEILYFKLNEELEIPLPIPADLSFLQEKWITIDIKAAKEEFGYDSFLDNLKEQNPQFAKIEDENNQKMKLIEENWYRIAKENELLILNSVETEKMDGEKVYVYDFTLNKVGVVPFVKDLAILVEEEVTESDVTDITNLLSSLKTNSIVIEVLAKERLLKQVALAVSVDAIEDVADFEGLDARLVFELSNHDQIESITVPEGEQITLEELMNEMMGSMMSGDVLGGSIPSDDKSYIMSDSIENDLDIDSDNDGINNIYEWTFYSTDEFNADSDDDGYDDLTEISGGYNPNGEGTFQNEFYIFSKTDPETCDVKYGDDVKFVKITQPNNLIEQAFDELMNDDDSALPTGLRLNSVKYYIDTLWLDFSEELLDVSGSCAVQAVRNQLTLTLGQFTKSSTLFITVNGQTEGILQP